MVHEYLDSMYIFQIRPKALQFHASRLPRSQHVGYITYRYLSARDYLARRRNHIKIQLKFHRIDVRAIVGKEERHAAVRKKNPIRRRQEKNESKERERERGRGRGKEEREKRRGEREREREREAEERRLISSPCVGAARWIRRAADRRRRHRQRARL